jgi:uncharacterized protein (DUF1501 family)
MNLAPLRRRELLRLGIGLGAGLAGPLASLPWFPRRARAGEADRILVVVELSGGNDGLNTVVPYGDDAYYRLRPRLGIRAEQLRKIDDHFGFPEGMAGFERLYKEGQLAIVHGCGYPDPSFSHFTSMAYWQTGAPHRGEEYGWLGRLADALSPETRSELLVNIDATQSLAVRSRRHTPLVFDDPEHFERMGEFAERELLGFVPRSAGSSPSESYLREVARAALESSRRVREAWAAYRTPVDYGLVSIDLPKVAALIAAGLPTRLFYAAFRNNAFDTHVYQRELHARLLTYASDALAAFLRDLERIGRAGDVTVVLFSEFGRRAAENTSLGTDHGAAGPMFVAGKGVHGGQYGAHPSLLELDAGGNPIHTTDFRRVYAAAAQRWLGLGDTRELLYGEFEPLPLFG